MSLNIYSTYKIISLILSVGLMITSLEDLKSWSVFHSKGLLSWRISRLLSKRTSQGFLSKILAFLLNDRFFKISIFFRVIGSGLLFLLTVLGLFSPALFCGLFIFNVLIAIRSPYSLDGAYQMNLIVLFALSIGAALGIGSQISVLCLWFITAELIISYFISGVRKLFSPIWRKHYALNVIFSTRTYGHGGVYRWVQKNNGVVILISWSIFLFETLFFTIFFCPLQYVLLFLIIGAFFHFSNALFMGLNNFLFAFLATYPALFYCVGMISWNAT